MFNALVKFGLLATLKSKNLIKYNEYLLEYEWLLQQLLKIINIRNNVLNDRKFKSFNNNLPERVFKRGEWFQVAATAT